MSPSKAEKTRSLSVWSGLGLNFVSTLGRKNALHSTGDIDTLKLDYANLIHVLRVFPCVPRSLSIAAGEMRGVLVVGHGVKVKVSVLLHPVPRPTHTTDFAHPIPMYAAVLRFRFSGGKEKETKLLCLTVKIERIERA